MDLSEGMVAVVRSLPDSGLAVSLLEGGREYTLMPNSVANNNTLTHQAQQLPIYDQVLKPKPVKCVSTEVETRTRSPQCHSGAQVVDGRYASVYKMSHCNVSPSSPPVQLTEFPPQRAELCRGQGNFVVGGYGSGETNCSPTRASGSFRGAMNWPERGAVFAPRTSHEPDAFAQSLRKYPSTLSPEQSTEIVERLINYTQMKNSIKSQLRSHQASPTRLEISPGYDRKSCTAASMKTLRAYEPEVNIKSKVEDSPTKDINKKCELSSLECMKSPFVRSFDVRYLREYTNKRFKESVKSVSTYPYGHPVCPPIKERYDHLPPERKLSGIMCMNITNSVHTETQAAIPMVSREVATVPKKQPSTRNVAVPLSPSSSNSDSPNIQSKSAVQIKCPCKYIQTTELLDQSSQLKKSVHTCISSIDVFIDKKKKVKSCRKSKSHEEIRLNDDLEEEILQLIKDLSTCPDLDTEIDVRNQLLKKLRKTPKSNRNDKVRIKFGRCIRDHLYSHVDFKNFTKELSKELISKIKEHNMFFGSHSQHFLRAEVNPSKNYNDIDELIKEWLDDIPVKPLDYLGRHVEKEQILLTVASKIKYLIMSKVPPDCYNSLKPEILKIFEDIPIEINARSKTYYLQKKVNDIVTKIENVFCLYATDKKRWNHKRDHLRRDPFTYNNIQPTEEELKQFVKQELKEFCIKFHLKICPNTVENIVTELIDILVDSIEAIRYGNDEAVREEMLILLAHLIDTSQHESMYFVNNLIFNLKEMFKESFSGSIMPQTFIVLQNASMQTQNQYSDDITIEEITDEDIQNNLDLYTRQIVKQINEWILNIKATSGIDASFKQVVVNDLAEDIVDRHKYLELNPTSKVSDADELEHLKYQIFKWVNKLVGEENLETIEEASNLMHRIQNIPVPMLIRPIHNVGIKLPDRTRKIPGLKETTNHQSKNKRLSDPSTYATEIPGTSDPISNANRRRESSPGYLVNQCCAAKTLTQDLGIMTDGIQNQTEIAFEPSIAEAPRLQRTAFTETDVPQMFKSLPRGTSIVAAESPSPVSMFRNTSTPGRFPSEYMNDEVNQDDDENVQKNNSSSPPSPAGAARVDIKTCCPTKPSIKQLNEEYDEYVLNWVQQIPIITSNEEDEKLIPKMRLGIYNGIWKAITKINMNPTISANPFYYQDVLDDELEQLLDLLPTSTELANKKDLLKSQLIEKTTDVQKKIIDSVAPSSYKQQLVDNIANIRKIPKNLHEYKGDHIKLVEDAHILNVVEAFIMESRYRGHDNVKAAIYKKKLMKKIQELFDDLKKLYGKDMHKMRFATYKDDVFKALYSVPMPNDDTLKEEVDEILLGLEVEQWFADLPLKPITARVENFFRIKHKDALAKKIHNVEKQSCLANCEDEVRHDIARFLERLPLIEGQEKNSQFMVEELVNRLKNRPKDVIAGSENVNNFIDPNSYDNFSRNMQFCSSFSDAPDAKRPQIDQSSYMIIGGERANASYPYGGQYVQYRPNTPESQQQWYTIEEEGTIPSAMLSGPRQPRNVPGQVMLPSSKTMQGQEMYQPHSSAYSQGPASGMMIRNETIGGQSQQTRSFHQTMADPMVESRMQRSQAVQDQEVYSPKFTAYSQDPASEMMAINETVGGKSQQTRSFNQNMALPIIDSRMHNQSTQDPNSYTPRILEASASHKGQGTLCGQSCSRQGESCGAPGPSQRVALPRPSSPSSSPGVATEYGQGGSTRPESSRSHEGQGPSPTVIQGMGQLSSNGPDNFFRNAVGFSTPKQNAAVPHESRPRRRIREIESPRQETARRRLDLDDSDDSDKVEIRCRCFERVWRRKKMSRFFPCQDFGVDFPPCFPLRYPCPYYY